MPWQTLGFELLVIICLLAFLVFAWAGKLPSLDRFAQLIGMLNCRGGNILILLVFSLVGSFATIRMFYYLTQLSVDGKLQQDNAYALMALAFMTNQLTGAFTGALLKTMTGEEHSQQAPGQDYDRRSDSNMLWVVVGPNNKVYATRRTIDDAEEALKELKKNKPELFPSGTTEGWHVTGKQQFELDGLSE